MSEAEAPSGARMLSNVISRWKLACGVVAGAAVGVALTITRPAWPLATTSIVAWDVGCLVFLALILPHVWAKGAEDIRLHAAEQDQGRVAILALVLIATAASIVAIGAQLSIAKVEHGLLRDGHVALAFVTVALSWIVVQMIFALHYAHEYYDENQDCLGHDMKGLLFPGGELPDYRDFIHFSVVIGVAAQTADISFTSKELRRIGTVHSMVAFAFNTIVVALTINLLAGLF
jgi:uncharacterized membrane protein